jgi:hypothetical protein
VALNPGPLADLQVQVTRLAFEVGFAADLSRRLIQRR